MSTVFAEYNLRKWPIVVVHFNKVKVDDQQFQNHLYEFEELFAINRGKFRVIFDLTSSPDIPIRYLSKQIDMLKKYKTQISSSLVCSAVVISNPIIKALLDLFSNFYAFTRPNKIFSSMQEAKEWVEMQ